MKNKASSFARVGLALFLMVTLSGLSSRCHLRTASEGLSVEDFDHVDAGLTGTWQGVGSMSDAFWTTTDSLHDVIQFYYQPTMNGAEAVITRNGGDGFEWAATAVSTIVIGGDKYASMRILGGDESARFPWEGYLIVRYEFRAPGLVDIYFLDREASRYLDTLVDRHPSLELSEWGKVGEVPAADWRRMMLELLQTPEGSSMFSEYFGSFLRLEDIPVRPLIEPAPEQEPASEEPKEIVGETADKPGEEP